MSKQQLLKEPISTTLKQVLSMILINAPKLLAKDLFVFVVKPDTEQYTMFICVYSGTYLFDKSIRLAQEKIESYTAFAHSVSRSHLSCNVMIHASLDDNGLDIKKQFEISNSHQLFIIKVLPSTYTEELELWTYLRVPSQGD